MTIIKDMEIDRFGDHVIPGSIVGTTTQPLSHKQELIVSYVDDKDPQQIRVICSGNDLPEPQVDWKHIGTFCTGGYVIHVWHRRANVTISCRTNEWLI